MTVVTASKCIFCAISKREDAQSTRVIYSDGVWEALLVQHPATYGHFIIFPRNHYISLHSMGVLAGDLTIKAVQLAEEVIKRLKASGYYLKANNNIYTIEHTNTSHVAHIHMHIVPRYSIDDSFGPLGSEELQTYFNEYVALLSMT